MGRFGSLVCIVWSLVHRVDPTSAFVHLFVELHGRIDCLSSAENYHSRQHSGFRKCGELVLQPRHRSLDTLTYFCIFYIIGLIRTIDTYGI